MKLGKYYNNNAKNRYDMEKDKVLKHIKIKVVIEITANEIYDTINNIEKKLKSDIIYGFGGITGFDIYEVSKIECEEKL